MWLFTTAGFFSVVEHKDDANTLLVRARVQGDLENLRRVMPELGTIQETPDADYAYRATIGRAAFARGMGQVVMQLDYPNFKNAVLQAEGWEREHAYMGVWTVTRQELGKLDK
jgi:hypothetical protein